MGYSISEVSHITGLSTETLRYYDREGLLPELKRDVSDARVFQEQDLLWLELISLMKHYGFRLSEIGHFFSLCRRGMARLPEQRGMFQRQQNKTLNQLHIAQLNLIEFEEICSFMDTLDKTGSCPTAQEYQNPFLAVYQRILAGRSDPSCNVPPAS